VVVDGLACAAPSTCVQGAPSGKGVSKALCAIDTTPCKEGYDSECRGDFRVQCDSGFPVEEHTCDTGLHCLEGEFNGAMTGQCFPPVDCPASGQMVCAQNSAYHCVGGFPIREADCGTGFCVATAGYSACYAASDGPAPLKWQGIPAGSFAVGDKLLGDSRPQATLGAFSLLETEVTTGQYMACVAASACATPPDDAPTGLVTGQGDLPIVGLTADEAKNFCAWAGGALPTELEWEYAARNGGADVRYPWGDEAPTCASANVGIGGADCATQRLSGCSRAPDITAQGVCDLVGNVSEWVLAVPDTAGMTGDRGTDYLGLVTPETRQLVSDSDRSMLRGFRCARHSS
jgi:hypothetical protein